MAQFSDAVFIPSHLTKGLVAGAIAVVAGAVALSAGGYAMRQFSRVTAEEILAFITPPR